MHHIHPEPPDALAARQPDQATVRDWRSRFRRALLAATGSLLAAAAVSAPAIAATHHGAGDHGQRPVTYNFKTLNDQADPTFNQLLGINDRGVIAGYFGSGTPADTHPNKGYVLDPPYGQGNYVNENFPGSAQTQVTGINDKGETAGFYADGAGDNFGFVERNGAFTVAVDPNAPALGTGATTVEQFLGVNQHDIAVGFYTDANGNNRGFTYDVRTGEFSPVNVPGFVGVTATSINRDGTVAGFVQNGANTEGFVTGRHGTEIITGPQGATSTQALGINDEGEVVGSYMDGTGATHGFAWTARNGYTTIDDPNGVPGPTATTVVNGVNDRGQLVGFYLDKAGNTDGMLVTPSH